MFTIMFTSHIKFIVTTVLIAVVLGGCFPQSAQLDPWVPLPTEATTRRIVIFGDSLSVDARPETEPLVYADPANTVSWNVFGGTRVDHWLARMQVAPADACVIVALGTNDFGPLTVDQAKWSVLSALEALQSRGVRHVTWLTLNQTSANLRGKDIEVKTRGYNTFLLEVASWDAYPLGIEDWSAASDDRTDWLVADRVHHTQAGDDAYAQALARAAVC